MLLVAGCRKTPNSVDQMSDFLAFLASKMSEQSPVPGFIASKVVFGALEEKLLITANQKINWEEWKAIKKKCQDRTGSGNTKVQTCC